MPLGFQIRVNGVKAHPTHLLATSLICNYYLIQISHSFLNFMDISVATPDHSTYYYVTAFWPLLPFHRGIFHLHINNSLPINRPIIHTLPINSWVVLHTCLHKSLGQDLYKNFFHPIVYLYLVNALINSIARYVSIYCTYLKTYQREYRVSRGSQLKVCSGNIWSSKSNIEQKSIT